MSLLSSNWIQLALVTADPEAPQVLCDSSYWSIRSALDSCSLDSVKICSYVLLLKKK